MPAAGRPRRDWSGGSQPGDEEYPPWAGPADVPGWAGQDVRQRRPDHPSPPGGQDVTGDGGPRSQPSGRSAPHPAAGSLVTTFLPGEVQRVPDACTAVTPATLQAYLPGQRHTVAPRSLDGSAQSLCDWTLDARPRYRVLEVTIQAYSPSGLASGNGSATAAARDAYALARQHLTHPVKATHLPPATLTWVAGLGSSAFAAAQLPRPGPTNLVTVVVRDRNVLITVVSEGPADHQGGYSPASPPQLQAAAAAAARDILAHLP